MRILLDHSVPHPLRHFLPDHEVHTTHYRGWHLLQNGALFRNAIQEGYDLLITCDQSIRTLAMLAHDYLTVIRHQAAEQGEKGATTAPMRSRFP